MNKKYKIALIASVSTIGIFLMFFIMYPVSGERYENTIKDAYETKPAEVPFVVPEIAVTHLATPEAVKAIYMTACVATEPHFREKLVHIADTTEVNSIVIDVKDFSGTIAFSATDPLLKDNNGPGCRAKDLREFITELHEKGIYAIARITVFQDPYYAKLHPELAIKRASDGGVWKDRKGLSFIDVSAKPYWDYIVALGKESYAMGFDELNFDYIRFPSDGNMKDIDFSWGKGMSKAEALEHFFVYLHDAFKDTGAKTSADLFGMTTTNTNDLNIGQVLERTMPYFDFIAPMVYPSHYPPNFNGWKNPNNHPSELIKFVMSVGAERAVATTTPVAHFGGERVGTSTPAIYTKDSYNRNKLRPWLQDFDYGGDYGSAEVRGQIQATYDSGLNSWFLWDPKNVYTKEALKAE
ncbi:MAG: hypothetical protein HY228_02655 [Candidatus Yonathbacteria bacterium]|nr:hypothetical protein [Candidatus Yonathbacteria bacterium]